MLIKNLWRRKRIKLNQIFYNKSGDNIFKSNFFFNYKKYRHKRWRFQRSYITFNDNHIYTRFSPIVSYMPDYSIYINEGAHATKRININRFNQTFSFKTKFQLKKRLLYLYLCRKSESLKKFVWNRHMTKNFTKFDAHYEMLLLRLGFVNSMQQAKSYVSKGILEVNDYIKTQTTCLANKDFVAISDKCILDFRFTDSFYSKYKRGYVSKFRYIFCTFKQYLFLMILLDINDSFYKNIQFLVGILPFTSTINFSNLTFIYFSTILKNQWNFYIDFFMVKKFLQYNR